MIYILSDIHGNLLRFQSILDQIQLQDSDSLYVLGDVIDRHPDGIHILQQIMAMPNAKMLLGNHEYMMLRALGAPCDDHIDDGTALPHWYRNGGHVTHEGWNRLSEDQQAQIIRYLHALPLSYDLQMGNVRYKLVHGAPAEDFAHNTDPRYLNPTYFAVWKRWEADQMPAHDYTLIFGHTPTRYYQDCVPMKIWSNDGYIGIDCGSGYPEDKTHPNYPYGRLCCLRLNDGKVFYSQEESL